MSDFNLIKDPFARRSFITGAAKTMLGIGAMPMLSQLAAASETGAVTTAGLASKKGGKAKAVIYLYMAGGMSHLDTFDTKPGAETQGPVESIKTSADGVLISEYFPAMAKQMHNVAVVNSMNSTQGAHAQGRYYMHTSYFQRGTIRHPDMGAWSSRMQERSNPNLPGNVKIGGSNSGAGYFESEHAALPIGDPEAGLQYSKPFQGITQDRFASRLKKLNNMNAGFTKKFDIKQARAYASMYDEAVSLMKSKDLEVFDLAREKEEVRESYGRNRFGQGCLLARRLVENGVRFIEVSDGGWDTHGNNFEKVQQKGAVLDQALGALLADLEASGLLESTLIVLATEFGRTPKIHTDRDNGRNHYPQAFSCLLAGGGIKGGIKYGKTDDEGRKVVENQVSVTDFNATIATCMGISLTKKVVSPSGRPFTVADDGSVISDLLS